MNWRNRTLVLLLTILIASCNDKDSKTKLSEEKKETVSIGDEVISYLMEADELLPIFKNENIKIIDFRKPEFYNKEHIQGAVNIWRPDIEDKSYPYGGMMASKEQLEALFSKLGIQSNDTFVIYDDNGLCDSARLWWILQNYDYHNVKLLHGGITDWKTKLGPTSTETTISEKTDFKLSDAPSMKYYISKEDLKESLSDNILLLDTRTVDEFSGKRQKKGAFKGGRIKNSKLFNWADAIQFNGNKRLKSNEEIKAIYGPLNATLDDTIVVYCHSGVRSAHTTFVLTQLLGFRNVKNYDGSWTEWSHFNDLPFEQDSITSIKK